MKEMTRRGGSSLAFWDHMGGERADTMHQGKPKIRKELQSAPKAAAARFYQMLSGHAMTTTFLKTSGDG